MSNPNKRKMPLWIAHGRRKFINILFVMLCRKEIYLLGLVLESVQQRLSRRESYKNMAMKLAIFCIHHDETHIMIDHFSGF